MMKHTEGMSAELILKACEELTEISVELKRREQRGETMVLLNRGEKELMLFKATQYSNYSEHSRDKQPSYRECHREGALFRQKVELASPKPQKNMYKHINIFVLY